MLTRIARTSVIDRFVLLSGTLRIAVAIFEECGDQIDRPRDETDSYEESTTPNDRCDSSSNVETREEVIERHKRP
ncbi:MAG: hypothetical protein KF800_05925 [Lysobacter sp.]|nr:hypothetical protein [Lysobacter sp.]